MSPTKTGASLTIAFAGLEAPGLDAATGTALGFPLELELGIGQQNTNVSLSSLSRLLGNVDVVRAELSVPVGKSSPLALRISVDSDEPTVFDSPFMWTAFEQGTLFDAPARDWSIVIDGQSVVDLVVDALNDSLKEKIADGAFTLEAGPSGFWESDRAVVSLHGSINDACEVLWIEIDMGTEITVALKPSCPAPNVVRFDFAMDVDDNKLAVFTGAGHRMDLPPATRIDRIVDDGRPGVLAVSLRNGDTLVVAPDAQRQLRVVETYRRRPWFVGAQRLGELLFMPAQHGGGVVIDRIVARRTFQR